MRPEWDFNTHAGQNALNQCCNAFLHGLQAGAEKPSNMSKTTMVIQKPDESPTDFYESLCEVSRTYTPFDSEAAENQ